MEDRDRPPDLATQIVEFLPKVLAALFQADPIKIAEQFTRRQKTLESERSELLFQCVIEDLERHRDQLERLTQEQEAYFSKDWVSLYLDADKKARATRARTRILRIAKILCSSIRIEPTPEADQTEEMMRIATELTDDDVSVLRELRDAFDRYSNLPAHSPHSLAMPNVSGLTPNSVLSICGKLQSLGLVATPQQHATALGQFSYPPGGGFVPLDRAQMFLRFILDRPTCP